MLLRRSEAFSIFFFFHSSKVSFYRLVLHAQSLTGFKDRCQQELLTEQKLSKGIFRSVLCLLWTKSVDELDQVGSDFKVATDFISRERMQSAGFVSLLWSVLEVVFSAVLLTFSVDVFCMSESVLTLFSQQQQ